MFSLRLPDKSIIVSVLLSIALAPTANVAQTVTVADANLGNEVPREVPLSVKPRQGVIGENLWIAQRQQRTALVIGNESYEEGRLRNPVNDATDMAAALKRLGFELIDNGPLLNLNKRQMNEAIDKFRKRLRQGGVGVFYYAGHGVAIEGVNYLIPIKADLDVKEDIEYEAIPLGKVLTNMQATETQFNFIIVDACRDNPIYRQWPADSRSGRRPQGFAEEKENLARVTLIFYSARYGKTASDGKGRNSPFTSHLLRHIETPNLRIVEMKGGSG